MPPVIEIHEMTTESFIAISGVTGTDGMEYGGIDNDGLLDPA